MLHAAASAAAAARQLPLLPLLLRFQPTAMLRMLPPAAGVTCHAEKLHLSLCCDDARHDDACCMHRAAAGCRQGPFMCTCQRPAACCHRRRIQCCYGWPLAARPPPPLLYAAAAAAATRRRAPVHVVLRRVPGARRVPVMTRPPMVTAFDAAADGHVGGGGDDGGKGGTGRRLRAMHTRRSRWRWLHDERQRVSTTCRAPVLVLLRRRPGRTKMHTALKKEQSVRC